MTAVISPRRRQALAMTKRGVPVFPCEVGGKAPATPGGFYDATTNMDKINTWWQDADYNYGYRPADLPEPCVVLDIDLGADPADIARLPPTYTVLTPSGGEHRYYLAAEIFGNSAFAPHIDVRCGNGYVLGPGSVVNGKTYRPAMRGVAMAPLPAEVAAVLRARTEASATPMDGPDEDPGEWAIEGARAYLAGLEGDPGRYVIACALARNFGLTTATALSLWEASGQRTESSNPNGGETLEAKLDHARHYGRGRLGEGVALGCWLEHGDGQTAAEKFGHHVQTEPETPPAALAMWTVEQGLHRPAPTYLDDKGLIPEGGLIFAYGKPANHKTGWALATCLECAAAGRKVLYIAAEDGRSVMATRLPALLQQREVEPAALRDNWRSADFMCDLAKTDLAGMIEAAGYKPDLIVLDVASLFMAGDWNSPDVATGFMHGARRLANQTKAAVLMVAHPGKDEARGIIGSSQFRNLADAVILIEAEGGQVVATVEKMKNGEANRQVVRGLHSAIGGVPVVGAVETKRRERGDLDDENLAVHLAIAGALSHPAGLSHQSLAIRVAGDRLPDEDGAAFATRIAKVCVALRKKASRGSRLGSLATGAGGDRLYWAWHLDTAKEGAWCHAMA